MAEWMKGGRRRHGSRRRSSPTKNLILEKDDIDGDMPANQSILVSGESVSIMNRSFARILIVSVRARLTDTV
jgi:hypothetical protein